MSFTEDELQSFNTILEQRLQAHQRAMERAFDQVHVEIQRSVSQKLSDFQVRFETTLCEKLNLQQGQLLKAFSREFEQRQQHIEGNIDRMLAARLSGIEQLFSQDSPRDDSAKPLISEHVPERIDTIEVQTELAWEDLKAIMGSVIDGR